MASPANHLVVAPECCTIERGPGKLGHDSWMHAVVNVSDGGFVPLDNGTRLPLAHTTITLSQVMVVGTVAIVVVRGPAVPELLALCERAAQTIAPLVATVLVLPGGSPICTH